MEPTIIEDNYWQNFFRANIQSKLIAKYVLKLKYWTQKELRCQWFDGSFELMIV